MKKTVAIIGGGASGLFAAYQLDTDKFNVTIYEKNKTLGRKFLVAGDGGFNLTHSELIERMILQYTPECFLQESLLQFDNEFFQKWLIEIGIPTFVGSSKRVFPKQGIKPIDVLNSIKNKLIEKKVEFKFEESLLDWNKENSLQFSSGLMVNPDIVIFSLGGASWKVTGSDGSWVSLFKDKGINILPFQPSNCEFQLPWSQDFIDDFQGVPLKNIAIVCGDKKVKGEVVVTKLGLEGNAIYALSPEIRKQLNANDKAVVLMDLKPSLSGADIQKKWDVSTYKNKTAFLKSVLKLSKGQLGLFKSILSREEFMDVPKFLKLIKTLPIEIMGMAPIDEAISTVGGVDLTDVSNKFELNKYPNHYCVGEMLNWDAPTGGYLLQACFSMGMKLGYSLNQSN